LSKVQNNVLLGSSDKKAVRSNYWAFDLAVAFASRDPIRLPFTGKIQEVAYTDARRPVIISYAFGSRAKRALPFFPFITGTPVYVFPLISFSSQKIVILEIRTKLFFKFDD